MTNLSPAAMGTNPRLSTSTSYCTGKPYLQPSTTTTRSSLFMTMTHSLVIHDSPETILQAYKSSLDRPQPVKNANRDKGWKVTNI